MAAATSAGVPGLATRVITSREEWERLFAQASAPHFTQAWVYGEGKRSQGWWLERLALEGSDGTAAICQVLVRRVLAIPVVARINRGPLFLERAPSYEMQMAAYRALRQRWRFGRRGLLLVAPALPFSNASAALLRGAGFHQRRASGWGSSVIDLQPSLDAIRAALSSKWRNHLNGSLKAGIEVRVLKDLPAFEWMLDRHAGNMSAKGFVGPAVSFVRAMITATPDGFTAFQALIDNDPVCGILVARFGDQAETFLSWTSDAGRRSNAHHRLLWQVITETKGAGCRALDLGGYTTSEKYGAFKRGMKGQEYRLSGEWMTL